MEKSNKKEITYPKNPAGTHLRSSDIRNKVITHSWWEPEIQYAWSIGPAMSKFLHGLKEGKILGIHCHKCKRLITPPRSFCEYCYGPTDTWVELKDTGTINTYSISYLDPNANRIEDPILIGVISIDGAYPKPMGFMHYFGEMSKDEIKIGMRVKAVWKPENEREGAITDIKYFKPYGGD